MLQSKLLMVGGNLQVEGEVVHVVMHSCHNLTGLMQLATEARDIGFVAGPMSSKLNAKTIGGAQSSPTDKPVQGQLFPSRDFK